MTHDINIERLETSRGVRYFATCRRCYQSTMACWTEESATKALTGDCEPMKKEAR
jgi:hypothetical protein